MQKKWKDKQIIHELKRMSPVLAETALFDRVLFKIETRIEKRQKRFWKSITWRPWAHAGGWVAFAACFCLALTGVFYQQNKTDNADMDSYMFSISNPMVSETHEMDGIKVPFLLTDEPHAETTNILLSDEDHSDILSDI